MSKKPPVDPHQFIPAELHKEVDSLLQYLAERPFQSPRECPNCGCQDFCLDYTFQSSPLSIPRYRCHQCKRTFNQLTNTIFTGTRHEHLDKWYTLARWRLSGYNIQTISHEIGLATATCIRREKVIETFMQQNYLRLYTWWFSHQHFQSEERTPTVQAQADQFELWLKTLLSQEKATCPSCGRKDSYRIKQEKHRPAFVCGRCKKYFNLLSDTYLLDMHQPHLWTTFAHLMLLGGIDQDIANTLQVDRTLCNRWRHRMIKQIQAMEFNELAQWLTWQRSRRRVQINQQARAKNKANKTQSAQKTGNAKKPKKSK